MNRSLLVLLVAALATSLSCSKQPASSTAAAPATKHEHKAPHGGTAVELGNEAYHLELVRDAVVGKLSAYVLDGEMENFIRIAAPSFDIVAVISGQQTTLTFKPVANPATGEKVGDTSLFEAQAEWLKGTDKFDGVVLDLEIKGTTFKAVGFNFPKGNDKE